MGIQGLGHDAPREDGDALGGRMTLLAERTDLVRLARLGDVGFRITHEATPFDVQDQGGSATPRGHTASYHAECLTAHVLCLTGHVFRQGS